MLYVVWLHNPDPQEHFLFGIATAGKIYWYMYTYVQYSRVLYITGRYLAKCGKHQTLESAASNIIQHTYTFVRHGSSIYIHTYDVIIKLLVELTALA